MFGFGYAATCNRSSEARFTLLRPAFATGLNNHFVPTSTSWLGGKKKLHCSSN
jgi:hypothetical protein